MFTTTPQISSPSVNCSPMQASNCMSQQPASVASENRCRRSPDSSQPSCSVQPSGRDNYKKLHSISNKAEPNWLLPCQDSCCTHRVQPELVQQLLVAARDQNGPLAAILAGFVLPLWLDTLLEKVEVCAWLQPAGWLDVVVQAASARQQVSAAGLMSSLPACRCSRLRGC